MCTINLIDFDSKQPRHLMLQIWYVCISVCLSVCVCVCVYIYIYIYIYYFFFFFYFFFFYFLFIFLFFIFFLSCLFYKTALMVSAKINCISVSMRQRLCFQAKPNAPVLSVSPQESIITFKDVYFEYVPGHRILNGLTFTVPSGKKVAIVGGSGSGYV